MTTRERIFAPGMPCWADLMTSDKPRARQFYGELLGWTFDPDDPNFGGYANARTDGLPIAGMMEHQPGDESPDTWGTYFATADITASVRTATEAGATILAEEMAVADLGKMAVLTDPFGAQFGFWQADTFAGFGKFGENGAPAWTEYHSTDFARSKAFYSAALGCVCESMGDSDDFRYDVLRIGEEFAGGMLEIAADPGARSRWINYFALADVDAAIAKLPDIGGQLLEGPHDSPHGRLAEIADPTGARLKIIDPSRATEQ